MFGLYENFEQKEKTRLIDFIGLYRLIKNHPNKEQILDLHILNKGTPEYNAQKVKLPLITAPCICEGGKAKENIKAMSGYMFFDIDKVSNLDEVKGRLLSEHGDKISLLSKSVGGRGISFYVRCDGLTVDNYAYVYMKLSEEFVGFELDGSCKNPNRLHYIPYDPDVYINHDVCINAEDYTKIMKNKKCVSQCIINNSIQFTTGLHTSREFDTIEISILLNKINWESYTCPTHLEYEIKPVQYCKLYLPPSIPDGRKRENFTQIICNLMYCNLDWTLLEVYSFMTYINSKRTAIHGWDTPRLRRFVESTYHKVRAGELRAATKLKMVHVNRLRGGNNRGLANILNGKITRARNYLKIILAQSQMQKEGAKLSVKSICERADIKSTKTYYNAIKGIDQEFVESIMKLILTEDEINILLDELKSVDEKCVRQSIIKGISEFTTDLHTLDLEHYIDSYGEKRGREIYEVQIQAA